MRNELFQQNSVILEEGSPQQLIMKPTSAIGNMLKDLNIDDYLFKTNALVQNFNRLQLYT